jgi:hypothetical protein
MLYLFLTKKVLPKLNLMFRAKSFRISREGFIKNLIVAEFFARWQARSWWSTWHPLLHSILPKRGVSLSTNKHFKLYDQNPEKRTVKLACPVPYINAKQRFSEENMSNILCLRFLKWVSTRTLTSLKIIYSYEFLANKLNLYQITKL